ncbi:MAG: M14 family zinc carboxypeptidase, partial [Bacteroidales bacterium]
QLQTVTTLASGRKIIVAKISDNVAIDEAEPEFLYTSSIHGDETTGYILMLDLMDYILPNYGSNSEITDLVNSMEIYINPLANPDGTYYGGNNTLNGARRGNANNVDLNRNYPDPLDGQHPDGYAWQPETMAFMDFAASRHFVASCNFHGGEEVVNYPWDTQYALAADDAWWQYVSHEYVDTARIHGNPAYMTSNNPTGITNGAVWYVVKGGRQDYMNYWHHCREVTIELSVTKKLQESLLLTYWNYNYRSLILYMKQATYGIHGIIADSVTGQPLAAKIFVTNHDVFNSETYSSANLGDYSRQLKAGTYTLQISAPNYQTRTISNVTVADKQTLNLNILLVPNMVITLPPNPIAQTTAISGGTINYSISGNVSSRGVCWSVSANPTLAGNHTMDGSGSGTYSSTVSGLVPSTLYHLRAYAVIAGNTVYGDDLTFTTSCGTINTFPWTEGFENGGFGPNCWNQEKVGSSTIDWIYVPGNGVANPATSHGGAFNACIKDFSTTDTKTKLITPSLNAAMLNNPVLKFWHTQSASVSRQDQLIVYYKTSAAGSWTVLATYTASISSWTQETINLPNASTDYYIAFEGNAKYGNGVCLDDVSVTGTVKTLSVSPLNQNVTSLSGSTVFNVISNSTWSVSSNQTWCTITSSGSGNASITATYAQNLSANSRIAEITVTVTGLPPVIVSVTQEAAPDKVLNLTLFIEGLFNGTNMNKARNSSGDQFAGQVADQVNIELHESTSPFALVAGPYTANLSTEGMATLNVPAAFSANYYLVVKHRNSIETWSSGAVSFNSAIINYNFSNSTAQAFGNNLKLVGGKCLLFAGDANQDGIVDSGDIIAIDNAASNFDSGYLANDINGDGLINALDLEITGTNAALFVARKMPE